MPNRRGTLKGLGINGSGWLENSSKLNKRGSWNKREGCWKILENLIAGMGWKKFSLIP